MIYCDGERDLFDEREFKHLEDGTLAHPYIHEQYPSDKRRPPHYADGGSPVNLQDISVLVSMTNATPSTVTPPSTSCCSPFAWSTQWPELPVVENNDPLLELKKIRYQAQVQAVAAQQAAIIDRDKAARANDYS